MLEILEVVEEEEEEEQLEQPRAVSFQELSATCDKFEVCRLFLASLQLVSHPPA